MDEPYVHELRQTWETLGETDPLWGVLSDPSKIGGRWDPAEFFASGREHIDAVMEDLFALGLARRRQTAVDFGCGVGRLTQALASHYNEVVGVDISASMIEAARAFDASGGHCTFVHNTRPDLQVIDTASADLVLSFIVLQHMRPDLARRYLCEFARMLRTGGVLVAQIPGYPRSGARDADALRAEITVDGLPDTAAAGSTLPIQVRVVNTSDLRWEPSADHPLRVGNHWYDQVGTLITLDDGRVALDLPLEPGAHQTVRLETTTPSEPGDYRLEIDAVEEGIGWFAAGGSPPFRTAIRIAEPGARLADPLILATPDEGWSPPVAFEMNAIAPSEVIALLEENDVRIVDVRADRSAGDAWHSYTYTAVKQSSSLVAARR